MKKTMIFTILALIMILMMVSFDISFSPNAPIPVPESVAPNALYVCPAASPAWEQYASILAKFRRPIVIGFFSVGILLCFIWAWSLYQNLLKDKFNRDSFKKPWGATKFFFWAIIIVIILMATPNHFRTVHLKNNPQNWVLCESNTPGAKVAPADMVIP
ncbi:MAG: hypothetical protein IKW67_01155 [Alphaproteobacteria bacterium]|nr:hypothetical protein [Alphaproteobacteria bacterium]